MPSISVRSRPCSTGRTFSCRRSRLLIAADAHQLRGVAGLAGDLQPGALQQAGDALAQQDVIVRHHDTLVGSIGVHPCKGPGP
jgi:hypothetical protein